MKVVVKMPVFGAKVIVYAGSGHKEELLKHSYHLDGVSYDARTFFTQTKCVKFYRKVVIHSRKELLSNIAHEAVHAAHFIYNDMGAEPSFTNDEYTAYMVGYICEQVEKAMKKKAKK